MLYIYKPIVNKLTKSLKLENNYLLKQIYKAINTVQHKIFLDKNCFMQLTFALRFLPTQVTEVSSLSLMVMKLSQNGRRLGWAHGQNFVTG